MPRTPKTLSRYCREVVPLIHRHTRGKRIMESVEAIVATDRWNSFDRFHETTETLVREFNAAGAAAEVHQAQTGGPVGTGRWVIHEAADVRHATVDIVRPIHKRVIDYQANPWQIIQWSGSTPKKGIQCDLAVVDTKEELERIRPGRLAGRMVLTRMPPRGLAGPLFEKGAVGLITQEEVKGVPQATRWAKLGWGHLSLDSAMTNLVGLVLSAREGDRLRRLIKKHGRLTLHVKVEVHRYVGHHDVVSGLILGRDDPQDEVWAIAHTAEPGAADNASGVAACLETARVLEGLIKRGRLPRPRRTIRLLGGYECYGFFHYLEHKRRMQPPLAGMCVDTIGTRVSRSSGRLSLHRTIPMSASFVDDVGEAVIRAALKQDDAGYGYRREGFVATLDTLIGDPKYGFPCPWITTHPFTGYHSSYDTPRNTLSSRGLATCTAAAAAYLYFLADAATGEAMELASWQTEIAEARLKDLGRKRTHADVELHRTQHKINMERLKRWLWGGDRPRVLAHFADCEKRVARAAKKALPRRKPPGKKTPRGAAAVLSSVPHRTAPLAPWYENLWPDMARRITSTGLPRWAFFWADGRRTVAEIAGYIEAETGKPVDLGLLADFMKAHEEIGYVKLEGSARRITKKQLVADLRRLGVKAGMDLMVHSSLSRIGQVAGGAEGVLDALLTAVGRRGTLMLPSFNHYRASVFNPLATPCLNGAIPEAGWRSPEAVRSIQATHSVACIGPKAERWCAGHLEAGVFGTDSPIGRLIREGGWILSIGTTNITSTAYHIAEISMPCGCVDQFGETNLVVTPKGEVAEVPGMLWRDGNCPVYAGRIDPVLDRRKLQAHGKVGFADARLVKAEHIYSIRREHLRKLCPSCRIKPLKQSRVWEQRHEARGLRSKKISGSHA